MKKKNGFTLIELMMVVMIIGILMSIALPSYRDYVLRSQITEAISTLSNMRVKMEQYFQDNRTYEGACEDGTIAEKPKNLQHFALTCDLDVNTYTLTATGLGFEFTLNEKNEMATSDTPDGWAESDACWVINKNGTCQ